MGQVLGSGCTNYCCPFFCWCTLTSSMNSWVMWRNFSWCLATFFPSRSRSSSCWLAWSIRLVMQWFLVCPLQQTCLHLGQRNIRCARIMALVKRFRRDWGTVRLLGVFVGRKDTLSLRVRGWCPPVFRRKLLLLRFDYATGWFALMIIALLKLRSIEFLLLNVLVCMVLSRRDREWCLKSNFWLPLNWARLVCRSSSCWLIYVR